jgi:hypothetical protein
VPFGLGQQATDSVDQNVGIKIQHSTRSR